MQAIPRNMSKECCGSDASLYNFSSGKTWKKLFDLWPSDDLGDWAETSNRQVGLGCSLILCNFLIKKKNRS